MDRIAVQICYARPERQLLRDIEVAPGTTILQAIMQSGVLRDSVEIDLASCRVGIYGKLQSMETVVRARDRIEVYRPLIASTHILAVPLRTRKLLLHKEEIKKLIGKVDRAGYTMVPLNLHYKGGRVKCEIGLAKGKKQHDKRSTERDRDSQREAQQAMKTNRR